MNWSKFISFGIQWSSRGRNISKIPPHIGIEYHIDTIYREDSFERVRLRYNHKSKRSKAKETHFLGLAEVELGKQTYKTYVGYFDPNTSEMNGKVQVTAYTRAEYSAAITALTGSEDLKTAFGNGGTAETSEIGTEATWNVCISAKLGTDTFQISLNRESMPGQTRSRP